MLHLVYTERIRTNRIPIYYYAYTDVPNQNPPCFGLEREKQALLRDAHLCEPLSPEGGAEDWLSLLAYLVGPAREGNVTNCIRSYACKGEIWPGAQFAGQSPWYYYCDLAPNIEVVLVSSHLFVVPRAGRFKSMQEDAKLYA